MKVCRRSFLSSSADSYVAVITWYRPNWTMVIAASIAVILVLLLFPVVPVGGAGRPTPDTGAPPAAGDTPVPPPTQTPLPVIVQDCASWSTTAPSDWPLALCDPFDDNRGGWVVGDHQDSLGSETRTVADGGYTWDMRATQPFFAGRQINLDPVTDFYAAVDGHTASGPEGNIQYGLQFRWTDANNFYMFLVSDFRNFKLYRYANGEMTALQDWTPAEAILANDWNRIAVKAVGPQLTLYVNDQQVAQITDSSLPAGQIRLVCQLLDTETPASVDFDNVEVRLPSAAVATGPTPIVPPPTEAAAVPTETLPPPPPPPATSTPVPPPALPTPTPPPTAVPVPPTLEGGWGGGLPTPETSDPTGWPIVFFDTFDDNGNAWVTGEDFDRLLESSKVIDETFAWQFKGIQGVHTSAEVPYPAVSDFYAAVDAKRYSGPEDVQYGLTFRRVDADNFYSFLVSDEQKFEATVQAKDRWYPLLPQTKSQAIRPGESNHIAVKCEGPKITFFINGQQVAEVEDIRFRKGTLALTLSIQQGDSGIMEFDNFELRAPAAQ